MVLSAKPIDLDKWPWNKDYTKGYVWQRDYTGNFEGLRTAVLRVDKVYISDTESTPAVVTLCKTDHRYYVQSFDLPTLEESCSLLGIAHLAELEGKTLDAYLVETNILEIKGTEVLGVKVRRELSAQEISARYAQHGGWDNNIHPL